MQLIRSLAVLLLAGVSVPAAAVLPVPPQAAGTQQAQPYLFYAGAGDVFEITSSMVALQKSQNPQVRALASMLIDHHTQTTNQALMMAKNAGVMAPPPELSPMQKDMVGQLMAASGTSFDRLYLQQQVSAHQQALALNSGYARSGDVAALRQNAQAAVPIIESHLAQARALARQAR